MINRALASIISHPVMASGSFWDWVNNTANLAKAAIVTVGTVVALGAFLFITFKGGFTVVKLFGGLIVAGLTIWGMVSGVIWVSGLATNTIQQ